MENSGILLDEEEEENLDMIDDDLDYQEDYGFDDTFEDDYERGEE